MGGHSHCQLLIAPLNHSPQREFLRPAHQQRRILGLLWLYQLRRYKRRLADKAKAFLVFAQLR